MNDHSIDIVVPTFRLNEEILLNIINLKQPLSLTVNIFIVADNPSVIVPDKIRRLHQSGKIYLLVNKQNLGAPGTRNAGIKAGSGKWILLLDDDIKPAEDILYVYADAMRRHENALGFAGVTIFPEPFNAVTKALVINGTISSFTEAQRKKGLTWAPTANVVLNRQKTDYGLFNENLVNSEDVDFLTRNSFLFNEKYISVPGAVVFHPWWNAGKMQTARIISYGAGAAQMARSAPLKNYTFRDFTNTGETLLLMLLIFPVAYFTGQLHLFFAFIAALLVAEFLTNWLKAWIIGHTSSLLVAFQLMWVKNCYELSYLYTSLSDGYINGFAQRIDMGFEKSFPRPFRTNRWKIIKMILLAILFLVAVVTF